MAKELIIAPSPHVHSSESTRRVMLDVVIALMPALAVSVWVFGADALRVVAIAVASCVGLEYLIQRFIMKSKSTICDLSAVVSGVLLGFNLPSSIPWWIVVVGAIITIGVAKLSFGGLGKNPFNPALVGRIFLLIAYPVQMTSFPEVDGTSGATLLAQVKAGLPVDSVAMNSLLSGAVPGSLGEVSALALLLGFGYLLVRKVITWHIPTVIFATMAIFAFAFAMGSGMSGAQLCQFPLFHLVAGGTMLGAIFMATDYSSSPMTVKGCVIYAVGIGTITMVIRLWGSYPEGLSFAIVTMNAVTPLINKYVKPRRFGAKK